MLHFRDSTIIGVTGGDAKISIDHRPVDTWTSHLVLAEQVVEIGLLRTGARAYLAVRGGIDSPPFLASRSTYTTSKIGGLDGEPLKAGDTLAVGDDTASEGRIGASIDTRLRPKLSDHTTVRVVEGLCNYRFTPESLREFFAARRRSLRSPIAPGTVSTAQHYRLSNGRSLSGRRQPQQRR